MTVPRCISICLAAAFLLASISAIAQTRGPTFRINGKLVSCHDLSGLDYALYQHNEVYFAGWSLQDYQTAIAWEDRCAPPQWEHEKQTRKSELQARLQVAQADLARQEEERKQQEAELAKQREAAAALQAQAQARAEAQARADAAAEQQRFARQQAAQARAEKRVAECRESVPYKLFKAQQRVVRDVERHEKARKILEHEQHVGEVSGYVNVYEEHEAGEIIVKSEEDLKADWADYKGLGGVGGDPYNAPGLSNPCTEN